MCGVAGIVALRDDVEPPTPEAIRSMVGALRHRGPDEFGLYRDRRAGLGHARLSIIDLESGQQPLCNEDGTIWIVFNGEIYNYIELREDLRARGHRFRTRSDTEVIVHAFEEWGEEAFPRFNGQFALAIWDTRTGALVFARDPTGICPLYLCEHRGRVVFASEVKAIFAADPGIPRAFDPAGLAETFTFWTVVPPQSVFRGIEELQPGHVRTLLRGQVRDHAFSRPRYPEGPDAGFPGSFEDAVVQVRASLEQAVRLRMLRADVPVGSYLSGGLDSSLVAALARRATDARFSTFSVRFEDAAYDETAYQRAAAERIGSDHHDIVVRRSDIVEALPAVVAHAERPLLRTAPAPLFLLSRLVHQAGIKVVLTGEGADEMFAGYDLFREAKVRRFWGRQPESRLRPRLLERLYPWLARSPVAARSMAREFFGAGRGAWRAPGFSHQLRWRSTAALQRLFTPELREEARMADVGARLLSSLPPEYARWTPLGQDQYLEVRTLLAGYLLSSQGDRMLMAHSVEGRFPFLDPEVIALADSLPPAYKLRVLAEKHVLKQAAVGLVPDTVIGRPKQPYRSPDALCFAGGAAPDWAREILSESAVAAAGVFDPGAVSRLARKIAAAPVTDSASNADDMALIGVLTTGLLHDSLIRQSPQAAGAVTFSTNVDRLVGPASSTGTNRRSEASPLP